jgi:hypothetical protein
MNAERKFIESKKIDDYEVLTDKGWVNIDAVHKTIPYDVCHLVTNKFELFCADNHIVFKDGREEYVRNLSKGDILDSILGPIEVISKESKGILENMYDLELDYESNRRYYTNGILSHNTSYIRYLAGKLKRNIIFISPDMVHHITEPEFIPFLMDNSDSILILEDAELALQKRDSFGSTGAVSNILNLTDGLLSDCLNISIVATFNTETKNVDEALLRKGRLLKAYKFEKLSVDKSKTLLKKEGHDPSGVTKPMSLADIYNFEDEVKGNPGAFNIPKKRIGF